MQLAWWLEELAGKYHQGRGWSGIAAPSLPLLSRQIISFVCALARSGPDPINPKNSHTSHRIIDNSIMRIWKWKIIRLKTGLLAPKNPWKLSVIRCYTWFSVWLRTDFNPADINRFRSHIEKKICFSRDNPSPLQRCISHIFTSVDREFQNLIILLEKKFSSVFCV